MTKRDAATHRRFRKKPVVIEAEQYAASSDRLPFEEQDVLQYDEDAHCQYIQTLESNRHVVSDGDWIIKGVKGEFYACKPDIFAMTYEPASTVSETPAKCDDTTVRRAEATMRILADDEADMKAEKEFWRGRARFFAEQILRSTPSATPTNPPGTVYVYSKELERLREIEHLVWHVLDDSEESGATGIICIHPRDDYFKLCSLLPAEHPGNE